MGTMKTYLAAEKKLVAATLAAYTVRSLGAAGLFADFDVAIICGVGGQAG